MTPRAPRAPHHEAAVRHALPGAGEQRAFWVDETTLAWPAELLPVSVDRDDVVSAGRRRPQGPLPVAFSLIACPTGGAEVVDGIVRLGAEGREVPLGIGGELSAEFLAAHPQLDGFLALTTLNEHGGKRLGRGDIERFLTGQLALVQRTDPEVGGWVTAFTGVQTWPLLDRLYGRTASRRDGSAPLGVTWVKADQGRTAPAFALWAPTATRVTLLSWETGDPTGSVPLVQGRPLRTPATRRPDGRWEVGAGVVGAGAQYLWELQVYVPATGRMETNVVTDPYSLALTVDSRRSVAVDLAQPDLVPSAWVRTPSPVVVNDSARTIYELHLRDFSAEDRSVPEALRGTYRAFTVDSAGTRHLRELAAAGMDTIHLLPTFDNATIPEDRSAQRSPRIPLDTSPASRRPQAAISAVADVDAYNWGYDPYHWAAPEGSYATEGNQDGGARCAEFRQMVGALHEIGLQVVLDQVFNHTAAAGQDKHSVLDRIVPGYYHRLNAAGTIEDSAFGANTATEHLMTERLMIDACVSWVRHYRVDGLRFDLMGYHSVDTMRRLRSALDALTVGADGVDGSLVFLYGEGWNMGEVADNALFTQAVQGQLGGTGIATFNDRLRDGVRGGSTVDADMRAAQGFGTGELTDPSPFDERREGELRLDLAWRTDMVRLALAGNLRDFVFTTGDGIRRRGGDLFYGTEPAAYGTEPAETINYVDVHDNETLFDVLAYKLPPQTSMADRVRMNTLCLATTALGQSPCLWAAGTELLRSKSLDRDSYNSGDWFNAIDFTGQDNGWGRGLPPAGGNFDSWVIQAGLLSNGSLLPSDTDIAAAKAAALDLLRLRRSTPLLSLGSARLIRERVRFPGSGPRTQPGVIVMVIDDGAAAGDIDPALDGLLVVFNATPHTISQQVQALVGRHFVLSPVQEEGSDPVVRQTKYDSVSGCVTVPARTVAVLIEP